MSTEPNCCKQKTYGSAKPFRCNTYKKHGVVGVPVMVDQVSDRIPVLSGKRRMRVPTRSGPSGAKDLSSNPMTKCVFRRIAAIQDSDPFARELSLTFQPSNIQICKRSLFLPIHRDPAQHLGRKIRGLLRHHFA